jgi:hypothetical protein
MESMSKGVGSDEPATDREARPSQGGALKSLLGFFVKVVPEEEAPPPSSAPSPQRPQGPAQRVSDLVSGEPQPQFKSPSAPGGELANRPFEEIYKQAGVPASPCSVDELARLLDNPTVANQPLSVKIVAVNLALSAKGVGHDAPIADAVRRDRALDAYQQMLDERASETERRNQSKIKQIAEETEQYLKKKQAEMEALKAEVAEAKRQSVDFSVRREAEERRMAELITPFLEGEPTPVTVGKKPEDATSGK